jgi:lysophospholipase L1-like esterase
MACHRLASSSTRWALMLSCAVALAGCAAGSVAPDSGSQGEGGGGEGGFSGGDGGHSGAGAGGAIGAGGSFGAGGKTGAGGSSAAGGRGGSGSGGTVGSGGSNVGSGGNVGTGGVTGTGGRGAGGAAMGGAPGTGGKGGATGGLGGRTGTLRIMPLGDSTTAAICYRSHLWQLLTQAGHTQFNFIGTRTGDPGCSFTGYDQDNEGHSGYIVTDLLKAVSTGRPSGGGDATTNPYDSSAKDLVTWFDGHPADIAIMHFGTNDVWNNIAAGQITLAYSAILAKLRSNNPNVRLLVAQITPLAPAGCTTCAAGVQALNSAIVTWARDNNMPTSPVSVVDQFTGFNATTDTVDGVHATDAGSLKIATNWFNALVPLF